MTKEEHENRIAELQTQIDELKKAKVEEDLPTPPHPRPYPKDNQIYFYVNSMGEIEETKWSSRYTADLRAREIGNAFMSETAAEFAAERLEVLAEMREWAGTNKDGAFIYYNYNFDDIMIDWDGDGYYHGDVRFHSIEDAENCIKAVGKDRIKKYYFMVSEEDT